MPPPNPTHAAPRGRLPPSSPLPMPSSSSSLPPASSCGMFQERRFGLFVHWGLYALGGWHEQAQWRLDIPAQDYQEQMHRFRPDAFSASQWLDAVEEAGMEYLCFTTKHHDGFCLWDTQATDYKITRTPWGRDPLAELSRECARRNIALSLYYSCPDWHCPYSLNFGGDHQLPRPNPGDTPDLVKYMEYVRLQVRELCTNYGPLAQFFWDIPPGLQVPSFNEEIRRLQPGILINNRGFGPGDYATPERHVPEGGAFTRLTEACQSVGRRSWGYRKDEDYFSPGFLIRSMDRIFAMGGNYLLNVGPDATGTIPPQARQILRQVGEWYRRCREAVVLAKPAPGLVDNPEVMLTRRDSVLYAHLPQGAISTGFSLEPLAVQPLQATLLNTGDPLDASVELLPEFYQMGPCLVVRGLPLDKLADTAPVVKLEFAPGALEEAQGKGWTPQIL